MRVGYEMILKKDPDLRVTYWASLLYQVALVSATNTVLFSLISEDIVSLLKKPSVALSFSFVFTHACPAEV